MKLKVIFAIAAMFAMPVSSAFAQALVFGSGSNSANASSWAGGAHAGYNWQSSSWVYGVEADISGLRLNSAMNTALTDGITTANANADINWYGTVRGRLGWSQGPVLFYGSGGLAYGRVVLNSSMNMPTGPLSLSTQTSSVKTGWVAGGGIDYMWSPNVIVGVQYQYVDLGSASFSSAVAIAGPASLGQSATTHAQFQLVTAGISWLFSPGGARGGWQGLYAGGQVGGAWGNDASAVYSSVSPPPVSDVRLKRDVVLLARLDNGLGLYRYRYIWSDTVYVGVMAQEVALLRPDAVVRNALDGYLRVDYGRLGFTLMTWPQWQAAARGERI
ncbi:MAG TPA: outer membrane beta-barrel protein [Xanthobacteraceae bacterium]|nr:outer membrane beta-barrel protein [Xanthobacteraceae bacterium]